VGGFYGKGVFWGEILGNGFRPSIAQGGSFYVVLLLEAALFLIFFLETIFLFSLFRKNEWFTLYNILFLFPGILTKSDDNDANTNKGACLEMTRIKQKNGC